MARDADLENVVRAEHSLLDPAVRASAPEVERLLHPDYVEFGASGRVWRRDDIVAALAAAPDVAGVAVDLHAEALADDVVLLTYRVEGRRPSLRSSVWVRDGDGRWRVRFHQGTLTPPIY